MVLGDSYRTNFQWYSQQSKPEYAEGDARAEQRDRVVSSAMYLAENMHEAPVLMIPCLEGDVEFATQGGASFWGSLFPAGGSYMLALRSRGLGSAGTTLHLINHGERQAAEPLGIA